MKHKIYKPSLYAILTKIPRGCVITYGRLAEMLGNKKWARALGNALHENPDGDKYPCYKVVGYDGKLSHGYAFGGIEEQKRRLEADGIVVKNGKVDLSKYSVDVKKWTFNEFQKAMAFDLKNRYCSEILFCINGSEKFDFCWMGKMPGETPGTEIYWFGLTADGEYAFDYPTFEELAHAKVFDGKSLFELWDNVTILEVDACEPWTRFSDYLSDEGRFMGAAQ